MAMLVRPTKLGVDISKDWIDVFDGNEYVNIENKRSEIKAFLQSLNGPVELAVEPTNRYHRELVSLALAAGHKVYLVDPYRVSRYREAIGVRAKTDPNDAQVLYRYLDAEGLRLTAYQPPPQVVERLLDLLRSRARLVKTQVSLTQSLRDVDGLESSVGAIQEQLSNAIDFIDRQMSKLIRESEYRGLYRLCLSIPGIGPLNAAGLVAIFHRGRFRKADSFIAYLGLDVRVRDSGHHRGLRKLTKKGSPELRRLLFNAARAGITTSHWGPYYKSLIERGFSTTAAAVALARKMARVAFAVMRDQQAFRECVIK